VATASQQVEIGCGVLAQPRVEILAEPMVAVELVEQLKKNSGTKAPDQFALPLST